MQMFSYICLFLSFSCSNTTRAKIEIFQFTFMILLNCTLVI